MRPRNLEKEEAIRTTALQIIAEEGLENLGMQKLAKAAGVSPRTIYIKYENKEDFLVKLYIGEVLGSYEKAMLVNFSDEQDFAEGVKVIWLNAYHYLIGNRHHFALMRYGTSSPLLNKAFMAAGIKQGEFFEPIHRFIDNNVKAGNIIALPFEAHRALLTSPLLDLVNEYFENLDRGKQIMTEELVLQCCEIVIKGLLK